MSRDSVKVEHYLSKWQSSGKRVNDQKAERCEETCLGFRVCHFVAEATIASIKKNHGYLYGCVELLGEKNRKELGSSILGRHIWIIEA